MHHNDNLKPSDFSEFSEILTLLNIEDRTTLSRDQIDDILTYTTAFAKRAVDLFELFSDKMEETNDDEFQTAIPLSFFLREQSRILGHLITGWRPCSMSAEGTLEDGETCPICGFHEETTEDIKPTVTT